MLRLLFIILLMYLIFRAIGNLFRASRGQEGIPGQMPRSSDGFRFDIRRRSGPRNQPSGRDDRVVRRNPNEDIEDARWTDVS